VLLINTDPHEDFLVKRGERIAQLVIQPRRVRDLHEVDELPSSERGSGGFGSTGS
jgi:dUTP pyrophosphatase